jgi:hypothetical protein
MENFVFAFEVGEKESKVSAREFLYIAAYNVKGYTDISV